MKNNLIKEEISRIREIMGFSLLVESKLPSSIWDELVTAFSKGNADALETSLKSMDGSVDSLGKAILETSTTLGKNTDEIISGLRAGTLTNDIAENLFANVLKQGDSTLKQTFLKNIDSNISDIFKTASDPNKKIKTNQGEKTLQDLANLNQLDNWVNRQKSFVDDSDFDSELKAAIKKQIDSDVVAIKRGSTIDIPKTDYKLEDVYDKLVLQGQSRGNKYPTMDKIIETERRLRKKFPNEQDAVSYYEKYAERDKKFAERVNKIGEDVEAALNLTGKPFFAGLKGLKKIYAILGFGVVALIVGGYVAHDKFTQSLSEAQERLKQLIQGCPKIEGSHKIIKDEEVFTEYLIKVIYNGTLVTVIYKDGEFYLDEKDSLGENIKIKCKDPKLADIKLESGVSQVEYSETLDEFKRFLKDNSMDSSDAVNDTQTGGSGFWKSGGKDYEYNSTSKTYIEQ